MIITKKKKEPPSWHAPMIGPLSSEYPPSPCPLTGGPSCGSRHWYATLRGFFSKFLFAHLPLEGLSRVFRSVSSPFSRAPSGSCPPERRSVLAACLSLGGVTAPPFSPCQAAQAPEVTYEADKGSMWTLLLTNLGKYLGLMGLPASPTSQEPGPSGAGGGARWRAAAPSKGGAGGGWQGVGSAGLFVCRWTPAGARCRVRPLADVSTWVGMGQRPALGPWHPGKSCT